ncbi:hypothetical protein [Microvirga makkahensis]|uniref:Uncharacterized protein n=1 Tax=Microvirga makkahensis TaxID=1128670 RepID=A0A7X3MT07_9HYPH|nr:hypothetical protein [Microvirga makkahensis]MXQ12667.1 hypothetical protein [Microvirga makkahensis]
MSGPADRPAMERITVAASFRQGGADAARCLLEDALTVVGATMVAYDPGMAAERHGEVLLERGEAALGRARRIWTAPTYTTPSRSTT